MRSLLELYAIDGSKIKGSGKKGQLLKGDIINHVTQNNLTIKPPRSGLFYYLAKTSILCIISCIFIVPLPRESSSPKSVTQTPVSRPVKGPGYVDIPLTGMRLTIAKRLTESKVYIINNT